MRTRIQRHVRRGLAQQAEQTETSIDVRRIKGQGPGLVNVLWVNAHGGPGRRDNGTEPY